MRARGDPLPHHARMGAGEAPQQRGPPQRSARPRRRRAPRVPRKDRLADLELLPDRSGGPGPPVVEHPGVGETGADLSELGADAKPLDRKSTRLNSSHGYISYAVFCLKKKKT